MPEHDDSPLPRVGTSADLARRMDRMEARHETLEGEVRSLAQTVTRVEQNQAHATELNKLRFDALDTGLKSLGAQLADFIRRIEGIITGEIQTAQAVQGRELVEDYRKWRSDTDARLDSLDTFATQGRLLGRLLVIVLGGNALVLIGAIAALVTHG